MPSHTKTRAGLAVLCLLLLTAASQAQVNQEWAVRYDGDNHGDDYGGPIVVDSTGNVIVTGQSQGGFLTIKYDPNGTPIWRRSDSIAGAGSPTALVVDDEDNVYVTGYSYTGWVYTGNQYVTIKYNSEGDRLWGTGFDGGGGPAEDVAYGVAVDDSGYVYVTGVSSWDGRTGIGTLKYQSNGQLSSTWPNIGYGTGVRRYDIPGQYGYQAGLAVAVDSEGNVYVTGASAPANGAPTDYLTLKYDASGNELWSRRYDGPAGQEDRPVAIAVDDSANVYVAGTALVPNQSGATRPDYATIKYDTNGNHKWVVLFNGPADYEDRCAALAIDDAGNIYVTGVAVSASPDYATIKYDTGGHQVWVAFHDGPMDGSDTATGLAVDDEGCVYVAGQVASATGQFDCETVKYSASGDECWSISYDGPDRQGDRPTGIALDGQGNVYVNGSSGSATCGDDFLTFRYTQVVSAVDSGVPTVGVLSENRPNPFGAATTIAFELARAQHVTLKVYDVTGREIAALVDADLAAGPHRRTFRADGLASGTYLCRLQADGFAATRKLVLVR
jgi:hypothetical protein